MFNFPFLYTKTMNDLMGDVGKCFLSIFGTQLSSSVVQQQSWSYTCAHHPVLDNSTDQTSSSLS